MNKFKILMLILLLIFSTTSAYPSGSVKIDAGDDNIGNVDVVTLPALVAGTAAIGKLAANSGVDIGDVDVTSISAGTNNIGDVDIDSLPAAGVIDTSAVGQTTDATLEAATTSLRLLGWSIREDAGTPAVATVVLRHDADGTCDGTGVIAFIELAANGSDQMSYGDRGLAIASGVCADILAGSVSVVIYTVVEAAP